jgi:GlpG protein
MKDIPITFSVIAISLFLALISLLGSNTAPINFLFFSNAQTGMPEIMRGQLWRLFTPMFIHFGLLHIVFNSIAMYQLGNIIERFHTKLTFISMILVFSLVSNLAQYIIAGPGFGGLSGVLFGLFGYCWIVGLRNPDSAVRLASMTVWTMLGWYLMCWSGALGNIANYAHTGGLVSGMAFAYISTIKSTCRKDESTVVDKFEDL